MPITAKKGGDFKQPEPGLTLAICYQVVALGDQEFKGSISPRVWIGFELPEQLIETREGTEKPMTMGKEFALFIGGKSKLGEALVAWRGGKAFTEEELDGFNIDNLAGKACQVNIGPRDSDPSKMEIKGIFALTKPQHAEAKAGKLKLDPVNPIVLYNPDEHDQKQYEKVPEFLRKKINQRVKHEDVYKTVSGPAPGGKEDFDDDIPF